MNFSAKALSKLVDLNANLVGVCTLSESNVNADHVDLSSIADGLCKFRFLRLQILTNRIQLWIQSREPDVIFCFGWSSLVLKF